VHSLPYHYLDNQEYTILVGHNNRFHIVSRHWAGQPRNHGCIPGRNKRFFSFPRCPDQLWGPSNLLLNGYHDMPRCKVAGHEAKHTHLSSAKVKNEWSCTSTFPYAFMACTGVHSSWWMKVIWVQIGLNCLRIRPSDRLYCVQCSAIWLCEAQRIPWPAEWL
jgi:hypothetical protein